MSAAAPLGVDLDVEPGSIEPLGVGDRDPRRRGEARAALVGACARAVAAVGGVTAAWIALWQGPRATAVERTHERRGRERVGHQRATPRRAVRARAR